MSSTTGSWQAGKRVAIVGGGPGGISTGLAFLKRGYDVRIFERQPKCQAIGGGVLLSTPVLAVLRSYGMSLDNIGSYTITNFANKSGAVRVQLPFNQEVERLMGVKGWHYGVLRSIFLSVRMEFVREFLDRHSAILNFSTVKSVFGSLGVKTSRGFRNIKGSSLTAGNTKPSMKKWSSGRVVCVGDAVHPVSPYAAYGMGMAIEDGYFLARALDGVDLRDIKAVQAGFEIYEKERIGYVNHNMEFARFLGRFFHKIPWPLAKLRDLILDYTPALKYFMQTGYLAKTEIETMNLKELHVC